MRLSRKLSKSFKLLLMKLISVVIVPMQLWLICRKIQRLPKELLLKLVVTMPKTMEEQLLIK